MTHRCPHVAEITAELREAGATDIAVTRQGGHVRIAWVLRGRACHVTSPLHPRDHVTAANTGRQRVRRVCREVRAS